jgi:hypothetical protein
VSLIATMRRHPWITFLVALALFWALLLVQGVVFDLGGESPPETGFGVEIS